MIEINTNNFDKLVLNSNKLVLLDLWAEWCGPCRMVTPTLEDISKEFSDQITVAKCNVDDNPMIAAKYGVRNIPTVLYLKNGLVVDKQIGVTSKNTFVNKINNLL